MRKKPKNGKKKSAEPDLPAQTRTRTIKVDYLARVEGEGALYIKTQGRAVKDVQLKIFEPPRFFEAFLRGRHFSESPDVTSRICGICPIAYQLSAVTAIEHAFGIEVPDTVQVLRQVVYCGEWIESHALHIYMLHAPDFLGYDDAIRMAKDHPTLVEQGLRLKKWGNEILRVFGGREIHPISVKVGGFFGLPGRSEVSALVESLKRARDLAAETVRWSSRLPMPQFTMDYEFVSLRHPHEYPMLGTNSRLVSNRGLDIGVPEFENHFEEIHVAHTNALHSVLKARGAYAVGPMARFSLNQDKLTTRTLQVLNGLGMTVDVRNPFHSIVVRALEVHHAVDRALSLLENYDPGQPCSVPVPSPGVDVIGYGCTEAPRGILYHRYAVGADGRIQDAQIIPPTSQNQKTIETDLRALVERNLDLEQDQLTRRCEQAIRNYDPCISCATHFLKVQVENV
jgi:sulfhydrogenase subunit alpha